MKTQHKFHDLAENKKVVEDQLSRLLYIQERYAKIKDVIFPNLTEEQENTFKREENTLENIKDLVLELLLKNEDPFYELYTPVEKQNRINEIYSKQFIKEFIDLRDEMNIRMNQELVLYTPKFEDEEEFKNIILFLAKIHPLDLEKLIIFLYKNKYGLNLESYTENNFNNKKFYNLMNSFNKKEQN